MWIDFQKITLQYAAGAGVWTHPQYNYSESGAGTTRGGRKVTSRQTTRSLPRGTVLHHR